MLFIPDLLELLWNSGLHGCGTPPSVPLQPNTQQKLIYLSCNYSFNPGHNPSLSLIYMMLSRPQVCYMLQNVCSVFVEYLVSPPLAHQL